MEQKQELWETGYFEVPLRVLNTSDSDVKTLTNASDAVPVSVREDLRGALRVTSGRRGRI
jgi:hypothetical protein